MSLPAHTPSRQRLPVRRRAQRGVSLVEALVALAVMSIGMLALVGVQTTMRLNADMAKQRSEATRIAREEIEGLRNFITLGAVPGRPNVSYDELTSRTVSSYTPLGGIGNTSYRVERTVTELADTKQKLVTVQVLWADRAGVDQTVTLDASISATPPTLGALLSVPHRESGASRRNGRHVSVPPVAFDMGNGSSRFAPPGAPTGLFWYFNNLSGEMRTCGVGVTDYLSCPKATLVSGSVRYHIASTQPTGADAENPAGPVFGLAANPNALVLADAWPTTTTAVCFSSLQGNAAVYFCAVAAPDSAGWGGQINPVPVDAGGTPLALGNVASAYKVCRYTTALPVLADDTTTPLVNEQDLQAQYTLNAEHPRKYCLERKRSNREALLHAADPAEAACTGRRVKVNLINQNFLVIRGNQTCPTEFNDNGSQRSDETRPDGSAVVYDPLVLGNTRPHQPFP